MKIFKNVLDSFLTLIYPKKCVLCREIIFDDFICQMCYNKLVIIEKPVCIKCGRNTENYNQRCKSCETALSYVDYNLSMFVYENEVKQAIYKFKFNDNPHFGIFFGNLMADFLVDNLKEKIDFITYVPIFKNRLRKKGFNHSEILARTISEKLNIPLLKYNLVRIKNTKHQSELSSKERAENVKDAFQVLDSLVVCHMTILIIDDILTTGSTLDNCAKALKTSGASKVFSFTLTLAV